MKTKIILTLILAGVLNSIKAQVVTTFAGSGAAASVDGTGIAASFKGPYGVCTDAAGNVYVADNMNHKIRKITPAGVVSTLAGSGAAGSADGPGIAASFNGPYGVCTDAAGNVYVADANNNKIRKITPAGVVSTLAGSGPIGSADGPGITASFSYPIKVCTDAAGNVYVADGNNNIIRKITPGGVVSTFAGGTYGFSYPSGICIDAAGNVYVCDRLNYKIRKITPAGIVSDFAGSGAAGSTDGPGNTATFTRPYDICTDAAGNFYVADGHGHKIRKITPAGVVSTFAGSGASGSTDATGISASFRYPFGVCTDAAGSVYVSDFGNNKIRKICTPCTIMPYDYIVPSGGTTTSALFSGATSIVNKNIYVLGPLTIDNNITFSGCNLVIAPSVGISLTTGDLALNNQTHIYGCPNMWNGITVPSGRTLSTSGSVLIEDALQAITIAQGAIVTIDQTIFNCNLTAIELTANTSVSSPLSISSSIITSRTIPFNAVPSLNPTFSTVSLNIKGASPYLPSVLKAPYSDRKGCYGINATDVALVNIGFNTINNTNYFDAIMSGVNLKRSNATIYNNRFQYLLGYGGTVACLIGTPCYFENGYGITASGNATGNYGITIGGLGSYQSNSFYNTCGAMNVVDYKTHIITNNSIDNSNTGPFGKFANNYGYMGIYLRTAVNQSVLINENSLIRNCATAISVNRTAASCATTQGITIDNNTITANASGYCVTGINMQDITGSTVSAANSIRISNNNITETQNCITASYIKSGLMITENNGMGIAYDATALRYGIRIQNCENVKVFKNVNINCTTPNINTIATANVRGIYVLNTRVAQVQCNQINNVSQALMFEGNCSGIYYPTLVRGNTLNSCYHGLYMKNNAELNIQGGPLAPSDNFYYGPFGSTYQTFTDNVSNVNTNSVFYVRSNGGLPTVPTNHGGTNPYVNNVGVVSIVANEFSGCYNVNTRTMNENSDQSSNTSDEEPEPSIGKTNVVATSLYPNPNNGMMMLDYSMPENETGVLTITDIIGKTISTYTFGSSSTQLSISEDQLLDGIYFYEIKVSNGYIKRDKLLIAR